MSRSGDPRLRRLVEAISDHQPVDWDAERTMHPALAPSFDAIRLLDGVIATYRALGGPPREGPVPTSVRSVRRRHVPRVRRVASAAQRKPTLLASGRWGPLHLLEKIGEGSFGEVFRAYDPGLEIEVALKLRHEAPGHDAGEDQILDEARRLARLHHPNVLVVHGVARHCRRLGMWSELLSGQTLEDLLAGGGPVSGAEAALIGIYVCRALGTLHTAGLVHRDVKTENIMRERGGRIVLMDFGAVREIDASGRVDSSEATIGTPLTMAPEVLRGEPASPASDIYSLGVLLYRMVSKSFPITARSLDQLLARHASGQRSRLPDRRPEIDPALAQAVERALEPDPVDRYTSAAAFERRLTECVRPPGRGDPTRPQAGVSGAPQAGPTNLPSPRTSFVGRTRELRECAELLSCGRLLTLTGFGGCGKTRLALAIAEELRGRFPDGVWFVDLALSDPSQVPQALASALSIRERAGDTLRQSLEDELRDMTALIVLDNCEHLLPACSDLVHSLLDRCDGVRVCATSREVLGIESEQIYTVPPLRLPRNLENAATSRIAEVESVRLFVERARLVRHDFRLTEWNAAAVAGICCRLEGSPLAIEIAAAKMRLLMPEEILLNISRRARLLDDKAPGPVARHQTLRAAFRWSCDLLTEAERSLLTTLTSFVGTWRIEDAVALHGGEEDEIFQTLTRLVGKSLVAVDHDHRFASCYRLLEPVRELANELCDARRARALRERHRDHFLGYAARIESGLAGPEQARWLEFIESEHGNLLAAVQTASSRAGHGPRAIKRDADAALGLVAAMWRYWYLRGHFSLGRAVLSRTVRTVGRNAGAGVRARAIWASGFLATFQGDSEAARPLFKQSLALFQSAKDRRGIARAHAGLGIVSTDRGDYAAARPHYEQSLRELRPVGTEGEVATALNNLGAVTWRLGDYEAAAALHVEGLQRARSAGHRESVILNLINLSWITLRQDRPDDARRWLLDVLPSIIELGARQRAAEVFEIAAEVLASGGAWPKAVRLAGRAEALREEIQAPPETIWREAQANFRTKARRVLGEARFDGSWVSGRELEFEQAAAQATHWLKELPIGATVP